MLPHPISPRDSPVPPPVRFSATELDQQAPADATLAEALKRFREDGYVLFENVFDAELMRAARAYFEQRYRRYLCGLDQSDALDVGDRRIFFSVILENVFNSPQWYANGLLIPVIKQLLGDDFLLGGSASVISLPGADDQHVHRDHPMLFHHGLDGMLPSYGLNLVTPLIELDARNGTTRLWAGSHRKPDEQTGLVDPYPPLGGCWLMDYRLKHGGLANRSRQPRPVLYTIYHRPWFIDYVNFVKQAPLLMTDDEYRKVPAMYRRLLQRVQAKRPHEIVT